MLNQAAQSSIEIRPASSVADTVPYERDSVEGRFETISVFESAHIIVRDLHSGTRIRCECDRALINKLCGHIGRRIIIFGAVRHNIRNELAITDLREIRILGDADDLPNVEDIRGLWSDDDKHSAIESHGDYLRGGWRGNSTT